MTDRGASPAVATAFLAIVVIVLGVSIGSQTLAVSERSESEAKFGVVDWEYESDEFVVTYHSGDSLAAENVYVRVENVNVSGTRRNFEWRWAELTESDRVVAGESVDVRGAVQRATDGGDPRVGRAYRPRESHPEPWSSVGWSGSQQEGPPNGGDNGPSNGGDNGPPNGGDNGPPNGGDNGPPNGGDDGPSTPTPTATATSTSTPTATPTATPTSTPSGEADGSTISFRAATVTVVWDDGDNSLVLGEWDGPDA
ncbi:hypothetical protein [Halogeometricum limi]|uniref:Archaeal Type IV pilin N-terminal domain-containing protein n=1 Tax=Halogeometricum limi TaxID=555875 RepID=A0A1I6I685_9EURY|nr:hypothetical protein [Halogeometricum limi]SFR61920.1 hypothetical protein SAMN04488124_2851 [Halogeometricum limi]